MQGLRSDFSSSVSLVAKSAVGSGDARILVTDGRVQVR